MRDLETWGETPRNYEVSFARGRALTRSGGNKGLAWHSFGAQSELQLAAGRPRRYRARVSFTYTNLPPEKEREREKWATGHLGTRQASENAPDERAATSSWPLSSCDPQVCHDQFARKRTSHTYISVRTCLRTVAPSRHKFTTCERVVSGSISGTDL